MCQENGSLANFLGTSTAFLPTEEYCFLCLNFLFSSGNTSPEIGRGLCGSSFCATHFSAQCGRVRGFLSHTACLPLSDGE